MKPLRPDDQIHGFLKTRYSQGAKGSVIDDIIGMWEKYRPYADSNLLKELCGGNECVFQQRYWEMYLACYILNHGVALSKKTDNEGPDIKIEQNGRVIWIEAISPTSGTGQNAIPELRMSTFGKPVVNDVPANEILLRCTSALDAKFAKYGEYLKNKTITPDDIFIVAINTAQLGPFGFDGISQYPVALEAVFPLGPQVVNISLVNSPPKVTSSEIQHRPQILNQNMAAISTAKFLNKNYSGISAVLATRRSDVHKYDNPVRPMVLVHNKVATNPLQSGSIRVDVEYWLEDITGGYKICKSNVVERSVA